MFRQDIAEMKESYEEKIQALKRDKHSRIQDLDSQILFEKENSDLLKEKIKQLSTYVRTTKELLKYKNDTSLGKNYL